MDWQPYTQGWWSRRRCQKVLCPGLAHGELCGPLQVRPTAWCPGSTWVQKEDILIWLSIKPVTHFLTDHNDTYGLPWWLSGQESACNAGDLRKTRPLNPWVRKIPWRWKWQPTPAFCLGNPMDRGAWRATVHAVTRRVRHDWVTLTTTNDTYALYFSLLKRFSCANACIWIVNSGNDWSDFLWFWSVVFQMGYVSSLGSQILLCSWYPCMRKEDHESKTLGPLTNILPSIQSRLSFLKKYNYIWKTDFILPN